MFSTYKIKLHIKRQIDDVVNLSNATKKAVVCLKIHMSESLFRSWSFFTSLHSAPFELPSADLLFLLPQITHLVMKNGFRYKIVKETNNKLLFENRLYRSSKLFHYLFQSLILLFNRSLRIDINYLAPFWVLFNRTKVSRDKDHRYSALI